MKMLILHAAGGRQHLCTWHCTYSNVVEVHIVVIVYPEVSRTRYALTVAFVFVEGMNGREGLSTLTTLYLLPTVSMHSLMTTQIGELRVRFQAHLTLKWLDASVNVLMLFQTTGC